jgi:hypothetical protein
VAKSNLAEVPPALTYRIEGREIVDSSGSGGKPIPTAALAWTGESGISAAELLVSVDPDDRSERDEAADFLEEYLAHGPRPANDVLGAARRAGHRERTLRRAKASRRVVAEPVRDAEGRLVSGPGGSRMIQAANMWIVAAWGHDLRHTCAALLVAQGAHVKQIADRLGHSSPAVTMRTYAHILPSLEEELAGALRTHTVRLRLELLPPPCPLSAPADVVTLPTTEGQRAT